jgi:hypothetical protein
MFGGGVCFDRLPDLQDRSPESVAMIRQAIKFLIIDKCKLFQGNL